MALSASELAILITAKDQATKVFGDVNKSAGGLGKGLGTLGKVAGGVAVAGIAAAGAAAVGLGLALADCVGAAMEAEKVQAALNAVLKSTGGAAGITAAAANDLANALSLVTPYEDELVLGAEAVLLRFRSIGKDVFPGATKAALDLATVMGTDAASAATTLGKALETPGEGLLRLKAAGVVFNDEEVKMLQSMVDAGDAAGAQAIILDRLNQSIGGAAAAAGATASGQWTIFNNQIQNVKETIGTALLPALTTMGSTLSAALAKPEVQAAITQLATSLGVLARDALPPLIDFLTTTAIPAMVTLAGILGGQVTPATTGVGQAFASVVTFIQPVIDALGPLFAALGQLVGILTPILLPALQMIVDMFLNVILPVMGDQFMNMLTTLIGAITGFVTFLTGAVEMIVGLFTGDMDKARAGAQKVMDGILAIFTAMAEGMLASVQNVIELIVGEFDQFGVDIIDIGKNIIDGLVKGITDNASAVASAIMNVVSGAVASVKTFLGIQSPSRLFAEIGRNIAQGLMGGINSQAAPLNADMTRLLTDVFLAFEFGTRQISKYGEKWSDEIKRRMQDYIKLAVITPGMSLADVVSQVYTRLITRLETADDHIKRSMAQVLKNNFAALASIVTSVGAAAIVPITGLDMANKLMGIAGTLGGLGSAAASRYETQILDPMREQLRILEEQGTQLGAISKLKSEIAEKEKMLAGLAKQQADLSFLQAQAELIKMIKENGLNASKILGGLKLGINADLQGVIKAMTAAMQAMVKAAQKELGIHSPSRIFAAMGENTMAAFGAGALRLAPAAAGMVGTGMRQIVNNNTYQFQLVANYKYESEQSLMDKAKILRMVYA